MTQFESNEAAEARRQQYQTFSQVLQSYSPPKRPSDPLVDSSCCLAYYEALRTADVGLQDKRTRVMRTHAMYYAAKALNDDGRMICSLGEYCVLASVPVAELLPKSIANHQSPPANDCIQDVAWPFETLVELLIEQGCINQAKQVLDEGASAFRSHGLVFDEDDWYGRLEYAEVLNDLAELKSECLAHIGANPGLLQSDFLKIRTDIDGYFLWQLANDGLVTRIKKGRSYQLYLAQEIQYPITQPERN